MKSVHTITASIGTNALDVISADFVLSEAYTPYARATLTCAIPAPDVLAQIDPRLNQRVRVKMLQRFGSSQTVSALSVALSGLTAASAFPSGWYASNISAAYGLPFNSFGTRRSTSKRANLILRSRSIDHVARTMTLVLTSDEARLHDYALLGDAAIAPGSTSVREIVAFVLSRVGAFLEPGSADGEVVADAVAWEVGETAWDYLQPLVDSVGLRLYCDEAANWHLAEPFNGTAGGVMLSASQSVTEAEDSIERDGAFYNAVQVIYKWSVDGMNYVEYDSAQEPGYSKVRVITLERPYPGPGYAAALLKRARGRGRVQAVEAVSDYGVSPGFAATITLPNTPVQTGIVASVAWRFPDNTMRVDTRELLDTPSTAWLFAPVGVSWNDIPAGIDWSEYTV